ncbi:hypothetical protein [Streptomyces sp. NPDC127033]|uniref:hypothetical protein n=1 Tax=Streptomyces sp. NPDC127033 TaxID=3347110 RepID=UPI00365BE14B
MRRPSRLRERAQWRRPAASAHRSAWSSAQRIGLRRRTRTDGTVTERKLTDEEEARRVLAEDFGIDASERLTLLR